MQSCWNSQCKGVTTARRVLPAGWAMRIALGTMAIVLGITGCTDQKAGKRLSPRGTPYLDGVAVPAGFTLVNKMVDAYESGGVRYARHEYRGAGDPYAVRDFYREQMPSLGWNRVSDQDVKGRITIRFEKQYEDCTVNIERGTWFGTTDVQVIVKPFSRSASPEPPKRLVP